MATRTKGVIRLSGELPEDFAGRLFDILLAVGADKKEAVRFRLGLEECLRACREHGLDEVKYTVSRRAARIVVRLRLPGAPYNPLYDLPGTDMDDSLRDYLSRVVTGFAYAYPGDVNLLVCRLSKKRRLPAYMPMAFAVAGALIVSQLLKLTPWAALARSEIVAPLASGFLRLLNTFTTPMIFFSVLCGLTNLADVGAAGTLGKSLMKRMCLWGVACAAAALPVALIAQGNFAGLGAGDLSFLPAARDMLLGMIPESFVGAFAANNALSVLLIAFLLAVVVNRRRDALPRLHPLLGELNEVFSDALAIVCKLLPVYVFLSVSKFALDHSAGTMLSVFRILGLYCIVWAALLISHTIILWAKFGRQTPAIVKGIFPGALTALTCASGASAMPQTMEDCRGALRMPDDLTRLGVPVYTVMNKPFSAANIVVMTVACAAISGVSLSLVQCAALIAMAFCLSVAAPPIPGGTTVCFAIVFAQFGVGEDMLALAVAAHAMITFLTTGGNNFSIHTQLVLLAKNMRNEKEAEQT